MLEISSW